MNRTWPALVVREAEAAAAPRAADGRPDVAERLSALLDDYAPRAIEDLVPEPVPAAGPWDPAGPRVTEPPRAPVCWRVFFDHARTRDAAAQALREQMPSLAVQRVDVPDEDWAARSQAMLTPVRAGAFVVAPPWHVSSPGEAATVVVIEPSMGFGTGHHATTRLCLRLLSATDVGGRRVLDLGTGSGVLAIAAVLKGAREAEGLDIDADAVASAERNSRLNVLPVAVRWRVADFRTGAVEPADVVLANLTGGLLTSAAPVIAALVRHGGALIVSGFESSEAAAVRRAFGGFAEETRLDEESWAALLLRRP